MQGHCSVLLFHKLNFWCRRKTSVFMSFPIWLSLNHNPYYVCLSSVINCIFLKGVEIATIKSSANTVQKFILETGLEFIFFLLKPPSLLKFSKPGCSFSFISSILQCLSLWIRFSRLNFSRSFFHLLPYAFCQQGWRVPLFVTGLVFSLNVKFLYRVMTFNLLFSDNSRNSPLEDLFFSVWPLLHECLFSELSPSDCTAFLKWGLKAKQEKFLHSIIYLSLRVSVVVQWVLFFLIRTVLWMFMLKLKKSFDMYQF